MILLLILNINIKMFIAYNKIDGFLGELLIRCLLIIYMCVYMCDMCVCMFIYVYMCVHMYTGSQYTIYSLFK